ncbi:MAG: sensor histidine kinase [Blastocatellia bacterium]
MRFRFSLFTRILLWFFLNLAVISLVLLVFFNLQFQLPPDSPLRGGAGNHFGPVAWLIAAEANGKTAEERDAILNRYSESYQLRFLLYARSGEKLAGQGDAAPEVLDHIKRAPPPREEAHRDGPPPRPNGQAQWNLPPPRRMPIFTLKTTNPTRYWAGVGVPVMEPGNAEPVHAILLAASDSISGHGLFFEPKPWLIIAAVVFGLSILLWLPFVRGITRSIKQMTAAAEQIADERFDVRVDERRTDEIGRLGKAINHLASRLDGFVHGQKRFLGDISHELNSPLARMQFALGILEECVGPEHQRSIEDAQEEVRLMSNLVSELLAYSKAGMKTSAIRLERVRLRPLVEQVVAREAAAQPIDIAVDEILEAMANPELLSRALANVIRNAVRYAAAAGPIAVSSASATDEISLSVADRGPGVPEEAIAKLFDPFYRLEPDRARSTGGAGLGLAIARTCIEACQGSVTARNQNPGLEVTLLLRKPL